jgi:ribosome-binding protein aMBF1 (putative translation factor)
VIAEWRDREAGDQEGTFMLLGDRVRELRKEHGWSQGELGTRIGTDAGRISRYEGARTHHGGTSTVHSSACSDSGSATSRS